MASQRATAPSGVAEPAPPAAAATNAVLLQAGALLPTDAALPAGTPSDPADVRRYRHPALHDRVVVRITPEPLAAADDAEMEVLGFGAPEVAPAVARTRRRALGFPAWALIHDPGRARHALAVVKELKALAKLARTKPGHAKDGLDAIADRLARTVPHFLPSFHEEAGRAFVEAGSPAHAATQFARAREAERVHALAVDVAARDRAFLEFALAGAVTGKALSALAQDLSSAADPAEAYARFRELCVRRTLGGMPPWTGMAKDLRRLAKAAGADVEAENARIVEELLDAPAVVHAAAEFWTAYGPAIARAALAAPALRGTLLRLFPEPAGPRAPFVVRWLELLEASGALAGVIAPRESVAAQALPPHGAAAWLSRLLLHCRTWRSEAPDEVFALVRRMAPRLRAEGEPVALAARWGGIDLDVLDLLGELEVPVTDPPARFGLRLEEWIRGSEGSKERPRDPVHALRDPRYRPRLEEAVGEAMQRSGFDAAARRMKGLAEARRTWVLARVAELARGTLSAAEDALAALGSATSARTFADLPEAWRALGEVDVASALARTLRGGVVDELGWPALEDAAAELAARTPALRPEVHGTFPYLVIRAGLTAIALGPAGRILEHELRLEKGQKVEDLVYAQGQLRVTGQGAGKVRAYWSGRPDDAFEAQDPFVWGADARVELELPDGALLRGRRALSAGDKGPSERGVVLSDGAAFWLVEEQAARELDPRTGALGRRSLPRFLEDFVAEGKPLALRDCSLHPLPAELRGRTPLGDRDGLAGLRVRTAGGFLEAEGIDGRTARLAPEGAFSIAGLVRLPGHERPRVLLRSHRVLHLVEPDGDVLAELKAPTAVPYARGTAVVLPSPAWHLLSVRDEPGSRALRGVTPGAARALLAAVRADRTAEKEDLAQARRALAANLPELTHPRLAAGVLGLARVAEALETRLERERVAWDPSRAQDEPEVSLDDEAVVVALRRLVAPGEGAMPTPGLLARELAEIGAFFAAGAESGGEPPAAAPLWKRALSAVGLAADATSREAGSEDLSRTPPLGGARWDLLVGATGAIAFIASSPLTDDRERAALCAFLAAWGETPFAGGGDFRRCTLDFPEGSAYAPVSNAKAGSLVTRGGSRWLVRPRSGHYGSDRNYPALERARRPGAFALLPGATLAGEARLDPDGWTRERIAAFLRALASRGPRPLPEDAIAELSRRTGITRAEAALVWAGLPGMNTWAHDFLGKEGRAALGLKTADAKVAQEALERVPAELRREVLAAAAAGPVEALWSPLGGGPADEESPVARLAAAWTRRMGRRVAIPPELVVRCARELPRAQEPAMFLAGIAECEQYGAWNRDGEWELADGEVARVAKGDDGEVFSDGVLLATARYLPFLFDALPVGDPLRARLPDLLRLTRERLAHPGLLAFAYSTYLQPDSPERAQLLDAVGRDPYPAGGDRGEGRDGGTVLARAGHWRMSVAFRPARLGPDLAAAPALVRDAATCRAVLALRSEGYSALAARVAATPVPPGGFEANPLLSVPALVAEVAAARGVGEEAAALYLQTLGHLAPTARAVQAWNGWTSARYRKAAAELAGKGLVVEAKRARAGRDHFLPGGWEELEAPEWPVETWKLPLHGASRGPGGIVRPLGVLLPLRPIHAVYEAAWRRVKDGDPPRYEEVQ